MTDPRPFIEKWEAELGGPTDSPRELGTVIRQAWTEDETGSYEHREIVGAIAKCPTCGRDVELLSDTDGWEELEPPAALRRAAYANRQPLPKVWLHDGYGPDMGECCGDLIVDSFDGCKVYSRPATAEGET
jgi:hypothetical protein